MLWIRGTANGARDLAMLVGFLDTGPRLNELVGLQLEDVHLDEGWLKVFGKGGKERIVPFGGRATKTLSRYLTCIRPDQASTDAFSERKRRSDHREHGEDAVRAAAGASPPRAVASPSAPAHVSPRPT